MNLRTRIAEAFDRYNTDKHNVHGYDETYAKIFDPPPSSILEIGVKRGRSLAAWRDIFPNVRLVGMDITDEWFVPTNIKVADDIIIADSTEYKLGEVFDVIVDDGSHHYEDIIHTFLNYKNNFKTFYVIEDVMFNHALIKEVITREGFQILHSQESKTEKNVMVDREFLVNNRKDKRSGIEYPTTLELFVVVKKVLPNQT